MNLLVIFEVLVALVIGFLAYVYWDIESRRRKFIQSGIPVLHQPVHFMSVLANLLPRNKFFMWLLPHRYPGIERAMSGYFKEFDSNLIAFVCFRFQEVFTNDPKVIKDIAVSRRKEFPKPSAPYDILRLFGENVVTAVDEEGEWKKHRMIVGPAFSEGNNALVAESTVLHLNRIMANWKKDLKDGKVSVDMDAEMVRLALAVIGQAGLGLDLSTAIDLVPAKSGKMHKMSLRDSLQNVCKYLVPRLIMPRILLRIPFGIFKVIRVSFDEFQTYMKDFCEERTASLNQRGESTKDRETLADSSAVMDAESEQRKETKRTDLLTKLLENNTVLTTDEIFGDIFIFLVAGHETTAHTLGWAVRLLAVYREKQEKLYKEAVSVLGDRDPTYEDYENLVYARCVFKESLRLFPQVNGIVKWTEEGNVLSGHTIPPKTMLAFSSPSVHIHPKYWESPTEFMPERFDHREPGHKAPDPYAFIPFAVGRRSCLGSKFAQVEGTLALAMLAKNWTFELPPDCTDKNFIFESMFLLTQQAKNQIPFVLKPRGKQE